MTGIGHESHDINNDDQSQMQTSSYQSVITDGRNKDISTTPSKEYKSNVKKKQQQIKCFSLGERVKNVLDKTLILFTDPELRGPHFLACVVWFTLSYGFYGLSEWMPSYLDTIDTVNTYTSTLFTNAASLPSCVITAYLMEAQGNKFFEWLDRRKILAIAMFGGAASLIGLLYIENGTQIVMLLSIFNAIVVCGWTALDVVSTELSPTFVRSTAYGVFTAFGRIGAILGNITFGVFGTHDFAGPLTICGISLVIGTVACLGLPNMKGKSTQ